MTLNKSIIAFGIALMGVSAIPAHAKTINIRCHYEGGGVSDTHFFRIDLNARTFTYMAEFENYHGEQINSGELPPDPIVAITDQWITWSVTPTPGAYQRINRTTLVIYQEMPGSQDFEPLIRGCRVIKKQL